MLPLETKQPGGKLLPHSDLHGEVFLEELSRGRKRKRDVLVLKLVNVEVKTTSDSIYL